MEQAKFYDSKGIIPKCEEDKQSYLERARNDLDALQRFYHDVREKKVGFISVGKISVENLLMAGGYKVLKDPSMEEYGFTELFFPNVVIPTESFNELPEEIKLKPQYRKVAINRNVVYKDRILRLTFVDESALEEIVSQEGKNISQFENALIENIKSLVGHEMIHGIRRLANLVWGYHFEDLVAHSSSSQKIDVWREYFSGWVRSVGLSQSRLNNELLLVEYDYLKEKVENGVAEKFPLPLLVRISLEEFADIAGQIEDGEEIKTIVNKKFENQPKDSWRWQLIAELCGY